MNEALEHVVRRGVLPMLGGILLVLLGLYVWPKPATPGGWAAVWPGLLVVVGLSVVVVALFMVFVPHLLPREE